MNDTKIKVSVSRNGLDSHEVDVEIQRQGDEKDVIIGMACAVEMLCRALDFSLDDFHLMCYAARAEKNQAARQGE